MDKSYEAPKGRVMTTVILFLFILAVLYTLFVWFQTRQNINEQKRLENEIVQVNAEIQALKDNQIEELVRAQDVTERVDRTAVKWSQVLKKLQDLTPVGVFFRSYAGAENGDIDISGLADNYDAVASVIRVLTESKEFTDEFVPTLAQGVTSDGQNVVSFNLHVHSTVK